VRQKQPQDDRRRRKHDEEQADFCSEYGQENAEIPDRREPEPVNQEIQNIPRAMKKAATCVSASSHASIPQQALGNKRQAQTPQE
jgi:hypothetical protein